MLIVPEEKCSERAELAKYERNKSSCRIKTIFRLCMCALCVSVYVYSVLCVCVCVTHPHMRHTQTTPTRQRREDDAPSEVRVACPLFNHDVGAVF